jgi:hypothetical protein
MDYMDRADAGIGEADCRSQVWLAVLQAEAP